MNDLIGLRYGWGHRPGDGSGMTDCFQLACEVHRRLGFADYGPAFAWVYEQFTEETFERRLLVRWLAENSSRLDGPRLGAVALLPAGAMGALGSVTETGVLMIGPGQNVVQAPVPPAAARFVWMNQ